MIIKIVVLAVAGVVFASYFKGVRAEYGLLVTLAVSIMIFYGIIVKLSEFISCFSEISSYFDGELALMSILIKMLGISYICELTAGICKDAGYNSAAASVVIFGKITIMVMGSSIIFSLMKIINALLI
jgi:stage III sporulation protein AD